MSVLNETSPLKKDRLFSKGACRVETRQKTLRLFRAHVLSTSKLLYAGHSSHPLRRIPVKSDPGADLHSSHVGDFWSFGCFSPRPIIAGFLTVTIKAAAGVPTCGAGSEPAWSVAGSSVGSKLPRSSPELWRFFCKKPILKTSRNHGSVTNLNISFLSFRVILHCHDYGRKGKWSHNYLQQNRYHSMYPAIYHWSMTSWWFQPIKKKNRQIWSFPQVGMKIKDIWETTT